MNNELELYVKDNKIANYFKLSTKKVAFIGIVLALNIVLALFGRFVLALLPLGGFLVIEITFFTYLISLFIVNGFYAIVLMFIATWFRLVIGDQWIGVLGINVDDLSVFIVFWSFYKLFDKIIATKKSNIIKMIIVSIITSFIAAIASGGFGVLYNYLFLLDLYSAMYKIPDLKNVEFLMLTFWFNILKYAINFLIFILSVKVIFILKDKHNI